MDKNQIKAELATIQDELRLSMESLNIAAFKFTLILDRYQMNQLGVGGLRTPPPRGIAQAEQQQPGYRPVSASSGGFAQQPVSPFRPASPVHPLTPRSRRFAQFQRPVRPGTQPCGSGEQQPAGRPITPPGPAPGAIGSFEIVGDDEIEASVDTLLASAMVVGNDLCCRPYQPSGRRC